MSVADTEGHFVLVAKQEASKLLLVGGGYAIRKSGLAVTLSGPGAAADVEGFSSLLESSKLEARRRIGERVMGLDGNQRRDWLLKFVSWVSNHAPKRMGGVTSALLQDIPQLSTSRVDAIKLTHTAAANHPEFRKLIVIADDRRDKGDFSHAEHDYWQALRLFPLHGGYRTQYAHMLKEQGKYPDALAHYLYSLNLGVPKHDVEEHLLFVGSRAGVSANASDVEAAATAWAEAERSRDDWDAPPIEDDFRNFAHLLWGNVNAITPDFVLPYLIKCRTRKELFVGLMGDDISIKANRLLLILLNEKGVRSV